MEGGGWKLWTFALTITTEWTWNTLHCSRLLVFQAERVGGRVGNYEPYLDQCDRIDMSSDVLKETSDKLWTHKRWNYVRKPTRIPIFNLTVENETWRFCKHFPLNFQNFSTYLSGGCTVCLCLPVCLVVVLSVSVYLSVWSSYCPSLPTCLSGRRTVCLCLPVCLVVVLSVSVYLSVWSSYCLSLSTCLTGCGTICLCLPVCLSVWSWYCLSLSTCLSGHRTVCLCLPICLVVVLSVSVYLSVWSSYCLSLSTCLSGRGTVCLCLPVCLVVVLSVSVYLSVCLVVVLSVSVYLSVWSLTFVLSVSVYLSVWLLSYPSVCCHLTGCCLFHSFLHFTLFVCMYNNIREVSTDTYLVCQANIWSDRPTGLHHFAP